jgi:pyruvate dehydrogenase E2 component (dihydrolipoamide acetyltransferase)
MVDVVMPQMGESIAEGTVIRWMKKVGESVERDEPLFEISTDKVDAEIPSPSAGVLQEILAEEGQTVAVNSVVARLSGEGGNGGEQPAPQESAAPAEAPQEAAAGKEEEQESAAAEEPQQFPEPQTAEEDQESTGQASVTSLEERRRTRSSPLVRKIAKENDVDISGIEGTGVSGRVTKKDILSYLDSPREEEPQPQKPQKPAAARAPQPPREPQQPSRSYSADDNVRIEPMSVMRRRISDHMVMSKRTSAHVTTVFEVDFTAIDRLRRKNRDSYSERGAKLTYLPFIAHATTAALREFPILNSSVDGDNIVYHNDINLGIAVALDWGLIVPVVRRADEKNILGLAKAIMDLGDRARGKKLNPDDVQGGTFTITNPGIYGGLFGTPIISQPQVAILGVGGVKKRPAVIETDEGDAIVIRSMCYLALTFDHRIIDGAVADQFMAHIRSTIESGNFQL